ncbi:hypothetical protein [Microbacterium sp. TPD7012]|uniref:hypothetical protein n=1 Tax=unclassified Microbacterium TaxID=2609290 RepID=UPI000D51D9A7|nr:hypothetical protein [Microbacterium sp. TPD7012]PVE93234.1 hypothetical protein DC434_16225 [Microbacterium sp. TPD7012]
MAFRARSFIRSLTCLLTAVVLTSCAVPEPAPTPEMAPLADQLVGEWVAETTDEARLRIDADGTFSIAGLCVASGNWSIGGDEVTATTTSLPDIGGCPDAFAIERTGITSVELVDADELRMLDDEGAHATFHRAD